MVYVGSNGGMLHAFNGGFYDSDTKSFLVSGKKYDNATPVIEHPLGAEIWAYTPIFTARRTSLTTNTSRT